MKQNLTIRNYNFKVTTIESGQRAKYGDSYFHFEIENISDIDYSEQVVQNFCTGFLRPARFSHEKRREELAKPDASFGLHFAPYWTEFKKVDDRKFVYKMVEPSTH
jgi:hypothetical protein